MINKKCKYCKKKFEQKQFRKNYKQKFCSIKCCSLYQKKHKIGWFSKDVDKKVKLINYINKTGLFDKRNRKLGVIAAHKIMKKNKLGFYNSKVQSKLGKIGGAKTAEILRNKYGYSFKGIKYSSNMEREIAICIYYQFEKIKEGKNYQIKIGNCHIDFFINDIFIEFHPYNALYDRDNYYLQRRKLLNENGYKDYPLLVIK